MLLSGVTSTSHPTILSMRITDPLAHLSVVRGGDHTSSINSSPRHDTVGTVFCLPLGRVFLVCPPPPKKTTAKTWGSSFRVSLPESCHGAQTWPVLYFPTVHEGLGSLAERGTTQC